jgi:AcrR family transcriptional regulator
MSETGGARRSRILAGMTASVAERGYAGTTVSDVCAAARVSRGTFYEEFDGLHECFLAVMDDAYRRVRALIVEAFAGEEEWLDGVRSALLALLSFFDREPSLARVWVVETLAAGSWALEQRELRVRGLLDTIVSRWPAPEGIAPNPLAAAGMVDIALARVQSLLLSESGEPFVSLLAPLMGIIASVYLGARAASAEVECAAVLASARAPERDAPALVGVELPDLLRDPRAVRARRCLLYVREHPSRSNRQIGRAAGIERPTQVSRLLARLRALGLLEKAQAPPGKANAWTLTTLGERVADALARHAPDTGRRYKSHSST